METLVPFMLFGSSLMFIGAVALMIIFLIVCDISESGTSAFILFMVFLGLNYWWGDLPLDSVFSWKNIVIYLSLGLVFSIIRTYFKGRKMTEEEKERFKKSKLKSSVFRWWFLFPFSLISWLFGELLKDLWNYVYSKFESLFIYVFDLK